MMRIQRPRVRARNGADKSSVTQLPSPPRQVRLSAAGVVLLSACAAIVAGSFVGAIALHADGVRAAEEAVLFASDAVPTNARIVRIQRRSGDDDRRTVHYEYSVGEQGYRNSTRVRDRDSYSVGSPLLVRYLPDDPSRSWIEGQGPRPFPVWPAYVIPVAAIFGAAVILAIVRRQRELLTYGRPAIATITNIDKKRSDKGSYWRVEYKWRLMSGATRTAHYNHGSKAAPPIGTTLPILYDRDNPQRQRRYPLPLVRLGRV